VLIYIVRGQMIGMLVAYPARWEPPVLLSAITDVVYEKNLGKGTAAIAERMTRYSPTPAGKGRQ
jgi:hypothetical protein